MDNDGCWGPVCIDKPVAERCHSFHRLVTTPTVAVRPGRAVSPVLNLPRKNTLARSVYDLIGLHHGLSDDGLEFYTGRSHQSVSAARNRLMERGLIKDSGRRTQTRYKNEAIIWVQVPL